MKSIARIFVLLFVVASAAITAGCGGNETSPAAAGLSISGVVYDISSQYASPATGVTVALRSAQDNSALLTGTTEGDGSFTLTGVPASQDVYINVSKAKYACFNSEVMNVTSSVSGRVLYIALAQNVQAIVDLIAWNDPSYTGYGSQSWLAIDIYDASGNEVPGITATGQTLDVTLLYNNGLDVFLPTGPTTSLAAHASASLIGGYSSTPGIYSITFADSSKTKTVKLPLVQGEMTYLSDFPW